MTPDTLLKYAVPADLRAAWLVEEEALRNMPYHDPAVAILRHIEAVKRLLAGTWILVPDKPRRRRPLPANGSARRSAIILGLLERAGERLAMIEAEMLDEGATE